MFVRAAKACYLRRADRSSKEVLMESPGARRSNTWLYVAIAAVAVCLLCACLACAILLGVAILTPSDGNTGPQPFPEVATVPVRPPARTPVRTPGLNVTPPASGGDDLRYGEVQSMPDMGADHVATGDYIDYEHYPPSSGTHYGETAEYGVHDAPLAPGYWVHNLEHGAVVILYRCDADCDARQAALQAFYDSAPPGRFDNVKLVIAPDERIAAPVVALAWGYQLNLAEVDPDALFGFYERFVDQGPEAVPA
jgi:hypothetical protein